MNQSWSMPLKRSAALVLRPIILMFGLVFGVQIDFRLVA
jgi:hypothetical protein